MLFRAFPSRKLKKISAFLNTYQYVEIKKCQPEINQIVSPRFMHVSSSFQRRGSASNRSCTLSTSKRVELPVSPKIQSFANVPCGGTAVPGSSQNLLGDVIENNDKLLGKIVASQKSKKLREKNNIIMLKGTKLIKLALAHGIQPQYIFYSKMQELQSLPSFKLSPEIIYDVKDRTIRDLLKCNESPGIVGIFSKPTVKLIESSIPVTVLCTDVREPYNLGTIIAIAAATGCKSVLLTKGCADPWEHKVLSTADGAHFHIPIRNNIDVKSILDVIPTDATVYIADGSTDVDLDDSHIYSDVEYADRFSDVPKTKVTGINFLESNETSVANRLTPNELELQKCDDYEIPCHLFSSVTFPKKDIVICMGGETESINPEIEWLSSKVNCQKLKIPLENEMDSLNVSSALSVILFEIQRQFDKRKKVKV